MSFKKVNERMTKKQIIQIYNEAIAKRKEENNGDEDDAIDTTPIVAAYVPEESSFDISQSVSALKSNIFDELNNFEKDMAAKRQRLLELNEKVEETKAKLDQLLQIEVTAGTLETLAESIVLAKEKEKNLAKEHAIKNDEWFDNFQKTRRRTESDWQYEFSRKKAHAEDEINDYVAKQKKLLEEEENSLFIAKEEFEAEKTKVQDMYDNVVLELSTCQNDLKAMKGQRNELRTKLSELEHSSEIAKSKLESDIDKLKTTSFSQTDLIVSLREENTTLRKELNEAYSKVQQIAQQSVTSAQPKIIQSPQTA